MVDEENHWYSQATADSLAKRVKALFEGLPHKEVRNALEELIDDYAYAQYGTTVMSELRKVRMAGDGKCVTIQTLAKGRAMLVSAYGFKVVSESQCRCGRGFLVLDELNQKDFERERLDRL